MKAFTPKVFTVISKFNIPNEYSYVEYLPDVDDQEYSNMCVPFALSAHIEWYYNINNNENIDNHIDKISIYKARTKAGNSGINFITALNFLKDKGVMTDHGNYKIADYLLVNSELAIKQALLLYGPCVASINYTNKNKNDFWNGEQNNEMQFHAVAIVGYNNEGFIIRNSWGKSYGNNGYYIISYEDFKNNMHECWIIIDK